MDERKTISSKVPIPAQTRISSVQSREGVASPKQGFMGGMAWGKGERGLSGHTEGFKTFPQSKGGGKGRGGRVTLYIPPSLNFFNRNRIQDKAGL